MSQSLNRPSLTGELGTLGRRLDRLERRTTPAAPAQPASIMFSFAGALTASLSPPARVLTGGVLSILAVTLGTAGTADVELLVGRNGATVATITIPAGTSVFDAPVNVSFGGSDQLVLGISDAGGAADMTAEARFV